MTDEQKRQIANKMIEARNKRDMKIFTNALASLVTEEKKKQSPPTIDTTNMPFNAVSYWDLVDLCHRDTKLINPSNLENIQYGYYTLSNIEKAILSKNNRDLNFIWEKLRGESIKKTPLARLGAGFLPDRADDMELFLGRIYMVSDTGIKSICIYLQPEEDGTPLTPINENSNWGLIYLGLFANFLANKSLIKKLTVTSAGRTVDKQAELIYYTTFIKGQHMYAYSSQLVKDNKDKPKNEVIQLLINHIENIKKINGYYKGFNHINSHKTIDISTNSEKGEAFKTEMVKAIDMFKNSNKVLSNKSLKDGEGGEVGCHHLVFY